MVTVFKNFGDKRKSGGKEMKDRNCRAVDAMSPGV